MPVCGRLRRRKGRPRRGELHSRWTAVQVLRIRGALKAGVAGRPAANSRCPFWWWGGRGCCCCCTRVLVVPSTGVLALALLTASHSNIATDAHPTALLGDGAAQLLVRLNGRSEVPAAHLLARTNIGTDNLISARHGLICILVPVLLDLFHEGEGEVVLALVAHGEVRKDEIARLGWPVQEDHARHRHTGEHWGRAGWSDSAAGDIVGVVQVSVEEEVRVVGEGDVLGVLPVRALEYLHLHHGRWINRSAIGRSCGFPVSWFCTRQKVEVYWLVSHFGPEPQARARSGCCRT
ncbi:hypothetical protein FJTKL_03619 [Diaporthe vaccinii]|uniref:Uncharacterized protein n=1 Tax=Diaporthe vaccinii TaxID=105482 RepID=A0ABR4DVF5_9PEZI